MRTSDVLNRGNLYQYIPNFSLFAYFIAYVFVRSEENTSCNSVLSLSDFCEVICRTKSHNRLMIPLKPQFLVCILKVDFFFFFVRY